MNRFANFMPELIGLIRRFPVPVFCSLWAFAINFDGHSFFGSSLRENGTFGLAAGFVAGGAAHLFLESRKWSFVPSLILAAIVAGAAWFLAYDPVLLQSHRLYLFLGLIMLLFVSPYLRRSVEQGAVWLFGLRVGLAALLAIVVGLTLMLGIYAIITGLKFLFGIDLGGSVEQQIFSLPVFLVGPLFGLSMIPEDVDEAINLSDQKGGLLERGVSILVNYIKVPLAFIYALLLHAYAVKIIVQQSMPHGEVGMVVSLFAIAGTLAWLLAWPFRDTGTRLLKLYSRFWFWFLPVPVLLLALAVWQRVSDYGMTQDRYGLVLVALWAGLVCVYLVLRRRFADMRVVIGSAALLLLLGSFGPWGAAETTVKSQFARLEKFLSDKAMLENGKLKTVLPSLSQEEKKQGHSMLQVLVGANADDKIYAFLPEGEKQISPQRGYVSDELSNRFGVNNYWLETSTYSFNAQVAPTATAFAGNGRVLGPFQFGQWMLNTNAVAGMPKFTKQNDVLMMTWTDSQGTGDVTLQIDQRTILGLFKDKKPSTGGGSPLPISFVASADYLMFITEGSGQLSDEKVELATLNFWVIEKK